MQSKRDYTDITWTLTAACWPGTGESLGYRETARVPPDLSVGVHGVRPANLVHSRYELSHDRNCLDAGFRQPVAHLHLCPCGGRKTVGGSSGTAPSTATAQLDLAQQGTLSTVGQGTLSRPFRAGGTADCGRVPGSGQCHTATAQARARRGILSLEAASLSGCDLYQSGRSYQGWSSVAAQRHERHPAHPFAPGSPIAWSAHGSAPVHGVSPAGVRGARRAAPPAGGDWRGSGRQHAHCRYRWQEGDPDQRAGSQGDRAMAQQATRQHHPEAISAPQGVVPLAQTAAAQGQTAQQGTATHHRSGAQGHARGSRYVPQCDVLCGRTIQRGSTEDGPYLGATGEPSRQRENHSPTGLQDQRRNPGGRALHITDVSPVWGTQQAAAHLSLPHLRDNGTERRNRGDQYPVSRSILHDPTEYASSCGGALCAPR